MNNMNILKKDDSSGDVFMHIEHALALWNRITNPLETDGQAPVSVAKSWSWIYLKQKSAPCDVKSNLE